MVIAFAGTCAEEAANTDDEVFASYRFAASDWDRISFSFRNVSRSVGIHISGFVSSESYHLQNFHAPKLLHNSRRDPLQSSRYSLDINNGSNITRPYTFVEHVVRVSCQAF